MKLSIVIPACNEAENIKDCLDALRRSLTPVPEIDYEIIVVDDNSSDDTAEIVRREQQSDESIRLVCRTDSRGYGRAVRSGLEVVTGNVAIPFMADLSDDPEDVIRYYRTIKEGYDCVFGSRFLRESRVTGYSLGKLIVNRLVNRLLQLLFLTPFNDLTNAFKAYRMKVIRTCGPYEGSHFNLTLEMSLSALSRRYLIAQIPISWNGRKKGTSKLRLLSMGRRYFATLMHAFFDHWLISDDLLQERLASERKLTGENSPDRREVSAPGAHASGSPGKRHSTSERLEDILDAVSAELESDGGSSAVCDEREAASRSPSSQPVEPT